MNNKKFKFVRVLWHDAMVMPPGWRCLDEIVNEEVPIMESSGFLISKSKEAIRLVGLFDPEGFANAIQIIPKGCIIKIEEV